jgi:hypothetical protein
VGGAAGGRAGAAGDHAFECGDWKRLLGQGSQGLEHLVDGTDLVREERQHTELIAGRFPLTESIRTASK